MGKYMSKTDLMKARERRIALDTEMPVMSAEEIAALTPAEKAARLEKMMGILGASNDLTSRLVRKQRKADRI